MNREERRQMIKQGASKENVEKLDFYQSPCSILEATQISRGVAEDVVTDYDKHMRPLQIAMSLQIELLKSVLIEKGLVTEDEFKSRYLELAKDFTAQQESAVPVDNAPKMNVSVSDVEVKVE